MLAELRKNASSGEEFIHMELKERISELEAQIERLQAEHAEEVNTPALSGKAAEEAAIASAETRNAQAKTVAKQATDKRSRKPLCPLNYGPITATWTTDGADTPPTLAKEDELKLLIIPMLDRCCGGRTVLVHGGTAAARKKCVRAALHSLRHMYHKQINLEVAEIERLQLFRHFYK